jgi:hypothetical protein
MTAVQEMQKDHSPAEVCFQLDSLRHEIGDAMAAISGNSLRSLEESLWRQEILCVSLKRLLQTLEGSHLSASAMARVHSTMTALYDLNRTYADLVEQSRASNHLLYTLCCSYKDAPAREMAGRTGIHCSLEA